MKLSTGGDGNFVKAPVGNHAARLTQIIDMGTQTTNFNNEEKQVHQIRFVFELVNELHTFDESKGPQPFTAVTTYTASMHPKAKLRLDLEAWRGKVYTEDEAANFDLKAVLGKPCMVSLSESKDGKYVNIKGLGGIPKGMEVPANHGPLIWFDLETPDWKVFDNLGKKTKEKIMLSPEYKAIMPI